MTMPNGAKIACVSEQALMYNLPNRTLFLILAVVLSALPGVAQKSGGGKSGGSGSHTTTSAPSSSYNPNYRPRSSEGEFDANVVFLSGDNHQLLKNDLPACFQWPMSPIQSNTVSAIGMELSSEAKDQFTSGCAAIQKKNLKDAEHRLNRVIELNPKYAAAWVLLGQANKEQGHIKEAVQFCTQAQEADANYLPAYLCLADLAARQDQWSEVAQLTNQVLAMHPTRAPGAYYYNTLANLYLKQWPSAEKSGLQALQDSSKSEKVELHWLLAKIYEEQHNRSAEAEHIREYLSLAPNGESADTAKHILKQIEAHPAK
jgi:tetratricopeptide (TPR) repeat protein